MSQIIGKMGFVCFIETGVYIDKSLKDHSLIPAIADINRLNELKKLELFIFATIAIRFLSDRGGIHKKY